MGKKKGSHRRPGGHRHPGRTTAPGGDRRAPGTITEGFVLLAEGLTAGHHEVADAVLGVLLQEPSAEVDAAVDEVVALAVARGWELGWQVADLVHYLGRKSTAPDRRLLVRAVSAASERWRHLASADPEWLAQVETVEADAGVEPGPSIVGAWAEAERVRRVDALVGMAELAGALWGLPRLPPAGDPPSAWGRRPPPRVTPAADASTADSRMLGKIRALLAKAESTEFAAEAESLSAKAQELMSRYAIDHALLAATGDAAGAGAEEPRSRRILIHDPYANGKSLLLAQVAHANRCQPIWFAEAGFSTIVGFATDLDLAELLFTSLVAQCSKAMQVASRDVANPRAFRSSFTQAFAIRIGERLEQAADDAIHGLAAERGSDDFLPILASRDEAVERAFDEAFPHRRTSRGARISDARGWHAGRAAADAASISSGAATLDP